MNECCAMNWSGEEGRIGFKVVRLVIGGGVHGHGAVSCVEKGGGGGCECPAAGPAIFRKRGVLESDGGGSTGRERMLSCIFLTSR